MLKWILIALGGGCGAMARFALAEKVYQYMGRHFPYGILTCNVLGSFLMGFLAILLAERLHLGLLWRLTILVGFLGGFTTFSSFSIDTVHFLQAATYLKAFVYIMLSVILCVLATSFGVLLAQKL